ncbi:hypothetical protein [Aeromicrobium sp. UC242_57]|uniref:hypothetical protein n=1 Tax=Aeromicrobium sp. UC242_57 TaxID=3374624 RepID=UPI0037A753D6
MGLHHEQDPQPEHDPGHCGHQVDQRDQDRLDPRRRPVGDEQGRREGERHRDQQSDQCDLERPERDGSDAQDVLARQPAVLGEERPAVRPERRHGLQAEEQRDREHDREHQQRDGPGAPDEPQVATGQTRRDLARLIDHLALECHKRPIV